MTLMIDLPPELESRLREEAAKNGLEASQYVLRLIERQLPSESSRGGSLWDTLSPEEWIREFEAWTESHRDLPVLPPEAYERASFYEGRD
jgi:hypothetical protein